MALAITNQTALPISNSSHATDAAQISKAQVLTGRVLSGIASAFLLFDGAMKLFKPEVVVKATVELGFPESSIVGIGVTLLAATLLHLMPRLSVLGALLLTGYLGGAVAANVRAATPFFNVLFPVIFGVIVWGGLWLRNPRVRQALNIK